MTSLKNSIPRLRSLLRQQANENQVFPLFPPKREKLIWEFTPIDRRRKAAILVPLVSYEGVPSLLFTTRSRNLPTHSSEVSFPGGHYNSAIDHSIEKTAIREAQEELLGDYPWDEVEIIGKASPLPSITGMPVTPIIAVLPYDINHHTFPGCPNEVEDVFSVSLKELLEVETSQRSERFQENIPAFHALNGKKIWGLTAIVTRYYNDLSKYYCRTRIIIFLRASPTIFNDCVLVFSYGLIFAFFILYKKKLLTFQATTTQSFQAYLFLVTLYFHNL